MDSLQVRHTSKGRLIIETVNRSALISDKDIPLLKRGQPVPVRDGAGTPVSHSDYALLRGRNVVIRFNKEEFAIPARLCYTPQVGVKRAFLPASVFAEEV